MEHNYVTTGELVWFTPKPRGGKVAAKVLGDIDYTARECTLIVTATKDSTYKRGEVLHKVPATQIYSRANWNPVTLAPQWLIYWHRTMPRIVEVYHHGNAYKRTVLSLDEFIHRIRVEAGQASPNPCYWVAGYDPSIKSNAGNGIEFGTYRTEDVLTRLRDYGRIDRGWYTWTIWGAQ